MGLRERLAAAGRRAKERAARRDREGLSAHARATELGRGTAPAEQAARQELVGDARARAEQVREGTADAKAVAAAEADQEKKAAA